MVLRSKAGRAMSSIAPSSPSSRPFDLAALRTLHLDPGCGCRTPTVTDQQLRPIARAGLVCPVTHLLVVRGASSADRRS